MAKRLENNPFLKDVQRVWKQKNHDDVISYLRGALKVGSHDMVYDQLTFLVELRRTLKSL